MYLVGTDRANTLFFVKSILAIPIAIGGGGGGNGIKDYFVKHAIEVSNFTQSSKHMMSCAETVSDPIMYVIDEAALPSNAD